MSGNYASPPAPSITLRKFNEEVLRLKAALETMGVY
jgi:hypothetical protein